METSQQEEMLVRKRILEVAEVFRENEKEFFSIYGNSLTRNEVKAYYAIRNCRTETLGGHVDKCSHCGFEKNSYNSCRNRHCPKCQFLRKEKWLVKENKNVLPVKYFHVVFTLPSELNSLIFNNKKIFYSLLFKTVSDTLRKVSKNKKYLNCIPGFLSILHTWGQTLSYHPHIHVLITGGGISADKGKWIDSRDKFFLPIPVLSKLFQRLFLFHLKKYYHGSYLTIPKSCEELNDPSHFQRFLTNLYSKKWIVYTKQPFENPDSVIKYLGRYTHRIAISNQRILEITNDTVTFRYKDYADNDKLKTMSLSGVEFIRRFLMHILPLGFVKIRHYGIIANRSRKDSLELCKSLLKKLNRSLNQKSTPEEWKDILESMIKKILLCSLCKVGSFVSISLIPKQIRPP
jgi:predicted Zn-ribbon and HTH transcriptional regulator